VRTGGFPRPFSSGYSLLDPFEVDKAIWTEARKVVFRFDHDVNYSLRYDPAMEVRDDFGVWHGGTAFAYYPSNFVHYEYPVDLSPGGYWRIFSKPNSVYVPGHYCVVPQSGTTVTT